MPEELHRPWPPRAGERLPGGDRVSARPEKWAGWILAPHGHGPDWNRALGVTLDDADRIWRQIVQRAGAGQIADVRHDRWGVTCSVDLTLAIDSRAATVRTVWHYGAAADAPRLVTAYPRS